MTRAPLIALLAVVAARAEAGSAAAPGTDPASSHDFGEVVRGAPVDHEFRLANPRQAAVRVARVMLTPPLVVTRLPGSIPPGGVAGIQVRLDTTQVDGPFDGEVMVFLEGVEEPTTLSIHGTIVRPVEIVPRPLVVLAAVRGDAKDASVDLVNHEAAPLRVEGVESPPGFSTRVETLDPGRRFRLHVALRADAPAGRAEAPILVRTSSPAAPLLHLAALTNVHERVYTFPDEIDLGAVRGAELSRTPDLAARLGQTLMVYQVGGSSFEARFRSDVAGVSVTAERGPAGDRWQATVLITGPPKPGPISGRIVIETNDPSFPRLLVPVTGTILP